MISLAGAAELLINAGDPEHIARLRILASLKDGRIRSWGEVLLCNAFGDHKDYPNAAVPAYVFETDLGFDWERSIYSDKPEWFESIPDSHDEWFNLYLEECVQETLRGIFGEVYGSTPKIR